MIRRSENIIDFMLNNFMIVSQLGPKYFLGSNTDGSLLKILLISPVIAKRKSVSTLIFVTPSCPAFLKISSEHPLLQEYLHHYCYTFRQV